MNVFLLKVPPLGLIFSTPKFETGGLVSLLSTNTRYVLTRFHLALSDKFPKATSDSSRSMMF